MKTCNCFVKVKNRNVPFPYLSKFARALYLSFLLLPIFVPGLSQTTSLSFNQIPYGNADLIAPGRGVEHWNGAIWDNTYNPQVPTGNSQGLNAYYRFNWRDIETGGINSYNWTIFDQQVNSAISQGKMFSFGIMTLCTACGPSGLIPDYLHQLMQGEATNSRDWNYSGTWIPNWNSPNYLGRFEALLNAVADHIKTTSYAGRAYKDVIYYVDVRGYGDFGEWHNYPYGNSAPTGRVATVASLKRIIDAHITAFPDYPLVIPMGAYDTQHDSDIPAEAAYYALTAKNNWGEIGWRRDNLGDAGYNDWLINNPGSYNGSAFNTLIMNKWRNAIIGGEPANDATAISRNCGTPHCDLENEIRTFHIASFGNGNYPISATNVSLRANVIAASKASGYRLVLTGGSMSTSLSPGSAFNVTLNWQNIGVAPTYENWDVVYELRNSTGGVVWTGTSSFKPKFFLPQGTSTPSSDGFSLPTGITPGTYSLFLLIKDPLGYKKPLPLAIAGRNTDGSYLLTSSVTVSTGSGNRAPSANAGPDQTIQLPTSTSSLSGTGQDPDGNISLYAWTKISGPSGGSIASPNSANTSISGLVQGVYTFRLTVTDNNGATAADECQLTVISSGGQPFTINAGPDQTLQAGATTVILSGTVPASGSLSDTVNLIVIQGESNAAGIANNSSALASELLPRSSIKILNNNTLNFENLDIGTNNNINQFVPSPTTQHGMELGLANEKEAGRLPNETYLVKIGASGSYISQWLPGSSRGLWEIYTPYVDAAIARLNAMGKKYRIIVWQSIGLNDKYSQGTTPANFTTMMAQFRTSFRNRYGANIRFLSTNFNNPPAQTFDWSYLWDNMAAADPLFVTVPVRGATYIDGGSHFDYAGFKLISKNMVDATLSSVPGTNGGGNTDTYNIIWSKVSGPTGGVIQSPNSASSSITGLLPGQYVFRLSVTNNLGTTLTDDVQVTVPLPPNQLPTANAGTDITISLPDSSSTLIGSGTDPDGSVVSYAWTKVTGPANVSIVSPSAASTNVTGLVAGSYVFRLTVTDNSGATAFDDVQITVNNLLAPVPPPNQVPIANAGADFGIELPTVSATLNGTGNDPDGRITAYSWTIFSGPGGGNITSPGSASTSITGLVEGVYIYRLTVTDNAGASATDDITIRVTAPTRLPDPTPANKPPVSNAGNNVSIDLPGQNSVQLDGNGSYDPDGTIIKWAWRVIDGPPGSTISNSNSSSARLTVAKKGKYDVELSVTDNGGLTSTSRKSILVTKTNAMPNAISTFDTSVVRLPVRNILLEGSTSFDTDGSIKSYKWSYLSGPSDFKIMNPDSSRTIVSNLSLGTYQFSLEVMDDDGAFDRKTVIVIVKNASGRREILDLKLYPNPAVSNVNININAEARGRSTITLFDVRNAPVYTEVFDKSTYTVTRNIKLNGFRKGVYYVMITVDNSEKTVTKLVIL